MTTDPTAEPTNGTTAATTADGTTAATTPLLVASGITQRFGSLVANDHVDFDVMAGEVHALLGENGAGKSTLMKVLYGVNVPQEGTVTVSGTPLEPGSTAASRAAGIGMVFQDLRLIPAFTVLENIDLALDSAGSRKERRAKLLEAGERWGLPVDPDRAVRDLSLAERQRVEILRVLLLDAKAVILDEPTSALAPQEVDALLAVVDQLRADGLGVVIITHKLRETRAIADRATILRGGKVTLGGADPKAFTDDELVELMVGSVPPPLPDQRPPRRNLTALAVNGLHVAGNDGRKAVRDVTFEVRAGELVGVAGVSGNGQLELLEAVLGVRTVDRGTVHIDGIDTTNRSPAAALAAGAYNVPEDLVEDAVVPGLSVLRTIALSGEPFPRKGLGIDWKALKARVEGRAEPKRLNLAALDRDVASLSGGNVQRVALTRMFLVDDPKLLVVAYPSRGLDIASVRATQQLLLERRAEGAAVLMVSEDLDELLGIADRLVVLHDGEIAGIVDAAGADRQQIGRLMLQGAAA